LLLLNNNFLASATVQQLMCNYEVLLELNSIFLRQPQPQQLCVCRFRPGRLRHPPARVRLVLPERNVRWPLRLALQHNSHVLYLPVNRMLSYRAPVSFSAPNRCSLTLPACLPHVVASRIRGNLSLSRQHYLLWPT
jgi:hypothetical protein